MAGYFPKGAGTYLGVLWDSWRVLEAKKRFKRAGIQNFQLFNNQTFIDKLILDVPCSGSGTIRRNPDMKWRFSIDNLKNLINTQKEIFDKSIKFLKKDGKIAYITCSIFKEENENQVEYFINKYNLKLEKMVRIDFKDNDMDCFFMANLSL